MTNAEFNRAIYATEKPRGGGDCGYFWASLQRALKHADLMAQSEVFHLEVNARTEDRTQGDKKRDQRSRHRMKKGQGQQRSIIPMAQIFPDFREGQG